VLRGKVRREEVVVSVCARHGDEGLRWERGEHELGEEVDLVDRGRAGVILFLRELSSNIRLSDKEVGVERRSSSSSSSMSIPDVGDSFHVLLGENSSLGISRSGSIGRDPGGLLYCHATRTGSRMHQLWRRDSRITRHQLKCGEGGPSKSCSYSIPVTTVRAGDVQWRGLDQPI
jgi:hypothetical protein